MRKLGTTEYAEILSALTEGKSDTEAKAALKVFSGFLVKHKAAGMIDDIRKAYERLIDKKEGRVRGTIGVAAKLSESERKEIESAVKKLFHTKEIVLEEKMDETLIGGWRVRTDEYLIDASLKGRLDRLKTTLTK